MSLLHELLYESATRAPHREALVGDAGRLDYGSLARAVEQCAAGFVRLGLGRADRVAIFAEKRFETVIALFGAAAAGGVFVAVNPLLKPPQVVHILRDCNVRLLVTSTERLQRLAPALRDCPDLRRVVVVGARAPLAAATTVPIVDWAECCAPGPGAAHRVIDGDMAAIFYTSGSTGLPKGVVLSHRNLVAGARSVAQYLGNHADDRILSALPLSFDAGFSQLTTAFLAGASVTLLNYLLPRDLMRTLENERITGLTAVPPLWIQLTQLEWPRSAREHLRYLANTGGRMPRATLERLRAALPQTRIYLMYGLTEAFRSTYLPPEELDRRPDSIGKAIPNAEVLVVREDGSPCNPGEPGELVHRGALVSLGYWNDPQKTAERFRPAPGRPGGLPFEEIAVWSGDTVRRDEEGFLYFIGRRDEMIKTSGYRVSPSEVEEALYASGLVGEAAAFGVPHAELGQVIAAAVTARADATLCVADVLAACRRRLPAYMVPARIVVREGGLPRNPNGKIDRKRLAQELAQPMGEPA